MEKQKVRGVPINSGTANTSLATTSRTSIAELSEIIFSDDTNTNNSEVLLMVNPKFNPPVVYAGNIEQAKAILRSYRRSTKRKIVNFQSKKYIQKGNSFPVKIAEFIGTLFGSAGGEFKKHSG